MTIAMNCPNCDEQYNFPDSRAGEKTRCTVCERPFTIDAPRRLRSVRGIVAAGKKADERTRQPQSQLGPPLPWWEEHVGLLILGGVVVLLIVGVAGVAIWAQREREIDQAIVEAIQSRPHEMPMANMPQFPGLQPQLDVRQASVDELLAAVTQRPGAMGLNNAMSAIEELGRRKEVKAVPVLVAQLKDFTLANRAVDALRAIGPEAESTLLNYLHDPDVQFRDKVRILLNDLKTKPELLLSATVTVLRSQDKTRQKEALNWLISRPVLDDKRAEVAQALAPLLRDPDRDVNELALRLLKPWAHKDCVPTLIALIEVPGGGFLDRRRYEAMNILAALKDERAAEALASRLEHFHERAIASRTLCAIGAPAEQALWKHLDAKDLSVRLEVLRILQTIATKKSVPALTKASMDRNGIVARQAKQTLDIVQKRN